MWVIESINQDINERELLKKASCQVLQRSTAGLKGKIRSKNMHVLKKPSGLRLHDEADTEILYSIPCQNKILGQPNNFILMEGNSVNEAPQGVNYFLS
ncbi:hypothetical protein QQP08_001417 [Theobroma cacao]|nr:hypothetical protein QQP08_001417 [Theobroma cacao]